MRRRNLGRWISILREEALGESDCAKSDPSELFGLCTPVLFIEGGLSEEGVCVSGRVALRGDELGRSKLGGSRGSDKRRREEWE